MKMKRQTLATTHSLLRTDMIYPAELTLDDGSGCAEQPGSRQEDDN
jgi:hypothetical protein